MISVLEMGAVPDSEQLQTAAFQAALDEIFCRGGGIVEVPAGKYMIGSIRVRSNTTLLLRTGAVLLGSRDPAQYILPENDPFEPLPQEWRTEKCWEPFVKGVERCYDFMKPGGRWGNAMIRAIGAENVSIIGEQNSQLEGCDCYDPYGEEKYRGPHGISMHHCRNVTFRGYTICNAGNWGHCIFDSSDILMEQVTVLAGHDGAHFTSCSNIQILDCSFYTGDDCIAGFANLNTFVSGCVCNTACSGLRFGGTNAHIQNCHFFGPAKYFFRGSLSLEEKQKGAQTHRPHRVNMLSVFTYYADFSVEIPYQPGNIIITNCTVENVDRFLHYNFSGNERWQAHRPLGSVRFDEIQAIGISMPLTAYGSAEVPLDIVLRNVKVSFREGTEGIAFLRAAHYDRICMENVTVEGLSKAPLVKTWTEGGSILLKNVNCGLSEGEMVQYTDEVFVCKAI